MSPDSPVVKYFRNSSGHQVPLRVLGTLAREKGLLSFKPLVIWPFDPEKCHAQPPARRPQHVNCQDQALSHGAARPSERVS
jgi:hypothetical protein